MKPLHTSVVNTLLISPAVFILLWALAKPLEAGMRSTEDFLSSLFVAALPSFAMLAFTASVTKRRWQWVMYAWSLIAWAALNAVTASIYDVNREFMEFIDLVVVGGACTGLSGLLSLIAYSFGRERRPYKHSSASAV